MEVVGYTSAGVIEVIVDGVRSMVPDDMGNRHRQMIAEWEAEGNEIAPYEPVPNPLGPLTARQIRLGLIASGISLAQVEAAIEAIPDEGERETAQVEWEYATQFLRHHPLMVQIATVLDLTDEQVDAMWASALTL
ncbi:hypothetical protein [Chelativorans sp. AA-79]|uniref:hypothetical protein n=1 Tax=Chelativorans sp. AA-79 TaxID=3028735 RepID=UPI0023F73C8C|nr:hypothetical protein [Chelativorans sp. AA-79]WEX07364.1 hypothetical protein PVE73_14660 [Chelativorans sp. AA-79]